MAAKALDKLAEEHEDFYVPTFTVLVGERDVVRELFLAVSSVQLDLKERTPGQFSFTVAQAFDLERRESSCSRSGARCGSASATARGRHSSCRAW